MSPKFTTDNDVVHADDLGDSFDASERCGYEITTDSLPDGWGGWCCHRPVWDGNERCIWHAEPYGKTAADLHEAQEYEHSWPQRYADTDWTRRLDHANLRGYEVNEERQDSRIHHTLSLQSCTLFDADFRHTDFSRSHFIRANLNGASFEDATCESTIFRDCVLDETAFQYANLENARLLRESVRDADWLGVRLHDANLHDSDFSGTNLRLAKLKNTYATEATLANCDLEEAEIEHTDLRDADLRDTKLYETRFRDIRLNEGTQFGEFCTYERRADREATELENPIESRGLLSRVRTAGRRFLNRIRSDSDDIEPLRKSTRVYRLYQRLLREASLPANIREFRVRERHVRRKLALRQNRFLQWIKLSFDRWVMLYGESPLRVVATSFAVILLFAAGYPLLGGLESPAGATTDSLYFSIATFTSLVYGNVQPTTEAARLAASLESLTGALLMALLVFVLGRRATW